VGLKKKGCCREWLDYPSAANANVWCNHVGYLVSATPLMDTPRRYWTRVFSHKWFWVDTYFNVRSNWTTN
jgi:hypothetical protein